MVRLYEDHQFIQHAPPIVKATGNFFEFQSKIVDPRRSIFALAVRTTI